MRIKDILPEEKFIPSKDRKPASDKIGQKKSETKDLGKRGKTGDLLDKKSKE
jgi:hypothetical protein